MGRERETQREIDRQNGQREGEKDRQQMRDTLNRFQGSVIDSFKSRSTFITLRNSSEKWSMCLNASDYRGFFFMVFGIGES